MTESLACPPPPLLILSPLPPLHPGSVDSAPGFHDSGIVNAVSSAPAHDFGTVEPANQFARLGSFPQTHGDTFGGLPRISARNSGADEETRLPCVVTGKPASCSDPRSGLYQMLTDSKSGIDKQPSSLASDSQPSRSSTVREQPDSMERKLQRKLQRGRSFSTDIDRDAAWEHKRELYQMGCEATGSTTTSTTSAANSNACDTEQKTWPRPSIKSRSRTRTWRLTDEDLEELRGSIDLGFGFRNDESYDLKTTLPALELYYAINRQYADAKTHSVTASPLDGITLRRTCSADSPRDSSREFLRICSPGDHPSQVKTRLRHWAQAVACSIKQGAGF